MTCKDHLGKESNEFFLGLSRTSGWVAIRARWKYKSQLLRSEICWGESTSWNWDSMIQSQPQMVGSNLFVVLMWMTYCIHISYLHILCTSIYIYIICIYIYLSYLMMLGISCGGRRFCHFPFLCWMAFLAHQAKYMKAEPHGLGSCYAVMVSEQMKAGLQLLLLMGFHGIVGLLELKMDREIQQPYCWNWRKFAFPFFKIPFLGW